ncbi:MAG: cysteine desulfurase-like protein [Bacteroidetes bacterium]|nr:cysteine desulfurase-like protein [Bacteroidota bacterium]
MNYKLDFIRSQFPALDKDWTYFDNAGGSQTLQSVAERISDYLLTSNVQLGASYNVSQESGSRVNQGFDFGKELVNAKHRSEVIYGSSTTMLLQQLSKSLVQTFQEGDEVIVTNVDHEANVGPWLEMQDAGVNIKFWEVNKETFELELDKLSELITEKTKLVAVTHASNVLGTIMPIKEIAELVHDAGALLCVDAVAFAPHRLIDVQELDVDFYVFSFYKVYGPHYSLLYCKQEILECIPGINHFFIGNEEGAYKMQPGNANFELSYGYLGYKDYLEACYSEHFDQSAKTFREKAVKVYDLFADHEEQLSKKFIEFLKTKPNVKIIGSEEWDKDIRVPTISFIVNGTKSDEIPIQVDEYMIGIRYGDFYARRLIESLDLMDNQGIIRVSMVHYNSLTEVDQLIQVLDQII